MKTGSGDKNKTPRTVDERAGGVEPEARPELGRRRLILTGLAAAPFILTLAARPAHAAGGMGSLGNYGGDYGDDPTRPGQPMRPEDPWRPEDPTRPHGMEQRPGADSTPRKPGSEG